jgi:hypothetical protein
MPFTDWYGENKEEILAEILGIDSDDESEDEN